jgi:hypothetical protein
MLTASKMAIAQKCAHWLGFDTPDSAQTARSRFGNAVHSEIERVLRDGELPIVGTVGDHARQALAFMLDSVISDPEPEITLGLDPIECESWRSSDTRACDGRHTLDGKRNKIACREGDRAGFYGTADLICNVGRDVCLVDWKTGHWVSAHENAQLVHLASCVLLMRPDLDKVCVCICKLGRYGYSADWSAVTRAQAVAHVCWLSELWAGLYDSSANPGPHCTFCPHVAACGGPHRADDAATEPEIDRAIARLYARKNALTAGIDRANKSPKTSIKISNNDQIFAINQLLTPPESALVCELWFDWRTACRGIGQERADQVFAELKRLEDK